MQDFFHKKPEVKNQKENFKSVLSEMLTDFLISNLTVFFTVESESSEYMVMTRIPQPKNDTAVKVAPIYENVIVSSISLKPCEDLKL